MPRRYGCRESGLHDPQVNRILIVSKMPDEQLKMRGDGLDPTRRLIQVVLSILSFKDHAEYLRHRHP